MATRPAMRSPISRSSTSAPAARVALDARPRELRSARDGQIDRRLNGVERPQTTERVQRVSGSGQPRREERGGDHDVLQSLHRSSSLQYAYEAPKTKFQAPKNVNPPRRAARDEFTLVFVLLCRGGAKGFAPVSITDLRPSS